MSDFENLRDELYPGGRILDFDTLRAELYPGGDTEEEQGRWDSAWQTFEMLHPRNGCYKFSNIKEGVNEQNRERILRPMRLGFFPSVRDEEELQELFRLAMNRGISAVNQLVDANLGDIGYDFTLDEIPEGLDMLEFFTEGRRQWIDARNGRYGDEDPHLMFGAYDRSRAYDLGYRVCMIEEEPKVISSVRQFPRILEWLDDILALDDRRDETINGFSSSWNTYADVRIYGNGKPMKARVKALDERGNIKHSSLLTKMYLKQAFFDDIGDYTGVELIVANPEDRKKIVSLFKRDAKPTMRLEDFQDRSRREGSHNEDSNSDFGNVSFKVRAAVPSDLSNVGTGYERLPVEVQVLTLEEDRIRRENPDVAHEAYKRKQFRKVFPILFPMVIYEPLMRERLVA